MGQTLAAIARVYGLTRQRVQQIAAFKGRSSK
jgi:DNA-directed RNA polymerase sigma subunit (sigma70/sigma32)